MALSSDPPQKVTPGGSHVLTPSPPFHMVLPGDNSYSAPHQSDNEAASEKRPEILNWQNHEGLDFQTLKVQMQPDWTWLSRPP